VFPPLQNLTDEALSTYLLHSNAACAYDATWSMALAWNSSLLDLLFEDDICSVYWELNKTENVKPHTDGLDTVTEQTEFSQSIGM